MRKDRTYWGRKQRKLRNRVRKLRATCDWLALDPLCETEANTWQPQVKLPSYIELINAETQRTIAKLKASLNKMQYTGSVARTPQGVSQTPH